MVEQLGKAASEALQLCLADLDAATTIGDITSNYAAEPVLKLDIQLTPFEGLRVRLRPHGVNGRSPVDWKNVRRVKIMEISFRA